MGVGHDVQLFLFVACCMINGVKTIELTGTVDVDGNCENGHDKGHWGNAPTIGGRCVVCAIESMERNLAIMLAYGGDEALYRGHAWADHGSRGWSSWTPAEPPMIVVGDFDLRERLAELDGKMVHLRLDAV